MNNWQSKFEVKRSNENVKSFIAHIFLKVIDLRQTKTKMILDLFYTYRRIHFTSENAHSFATLAASAGVRLRAMKRKSAPTHGPYGSGKDFTFLLVVGRRSESDLFGCLSSGRGAMVGAHRSALRRSRTPLAC